MTATQQPMAGQAAAAISARLDRLPATRYIWQLVLLLSLGGCFEFYDLFLTAYIGPGLVRSGLFSRASVSFFGFSGLASFVAATFVGLFLGTLVFGFAADKFGRRLIFTSSLLWYASATAVMAFQNSAAEIVLWRMIAGIGIGVELVTIDTYIVELMPKELRGRAFAVNELIQFSAVPVVALVAWRLVPLRPWGFRRMALGGAPRFDWSDFCLVHPATHSGKPALADRQRKTGAGRARDLRDGAARQRRGAGAIAAAEN